MILGNSIDIILHTIAIVTVILCNRSGRVTAVTTIQVNRVTITAVTNYCQYTEHQQHIAQTCFVKETKVAKYKIGHENMPTVCFAGNSIDATM